MSALRLNYPGQPVVLVELGPARGRVTGPQISGGSVWDAIPAIKGRTTFGKVTDHKPQPKSLVWDRCGRIMRTGDACHRRQGHSVGYCKSADAVERDNARRRARDFG